MTNIYMSWTQLKTKKTSEGLNLYYHQQDSYRIQLYLLDGADAYICYLATQKTLDSEGFIADDKTGLQTDLNDFNDNYKSSATETQGVKD